MYNAEQDFAIACAIIFAFCPKKAFDFFSQFVQKSLPFFFSGIWSAMKINLVNMMTFIMT